MKSGSSNNFNSRPNLADLRKSVPILELAKELGLAVTNNRARCLRPENHSHGDRTPSMSFNSVRNSFKCWVCPEVTGSVLDLVMIARGVSLTEAANYLSGQFRIESVPVRLAHSIAEQEKKVIPVESKPEMPNLRRVEILGKLLEICSKIPAEGVRYLRSRRISPKTAIQMKIGFVHDYSKTANLLCELFSKEELYVSGLFNDKGNFRFYQHKLLLPYMMNQQIVYIQARSIDPVVVPKELNLKGPIPCPYNYDALLNYKIVYLCEGVIDTLTLLDQGFQGVGIPGVGSFKNEWLPFFKGRKVYSVLDADTAGNNANEKLKKIFREAEIDFSVVPIPLGHDINDFFMGKTWKK
jgi:DNA primase